MGKGGQNYGKRETTGSNTQSNRVVFAAWAKDVGECEEELQVNRDFGLSPDEVEKRRQIYGWNELEKHEGQSIFSLILEQFNDTLVRILLVAAVISFVLALYDGDEGGEMAITAFVEPLVIFLILILNGIVGVWQESNAEKALEALKEIQSLQATVIRNGKKYSSLPAKELVPVKYCSENNKHLIHFSSCEVYGKTIGSYLPKDSPLRQRRHQKVPKICIGIVSAAWLAAAICVFIALPNHSWLWLISCFSTVQVVMTVVKYIPQAIMNFRRKSTIGFSIGNILLDLLGGLTNYGQMAVQSIDQHSLVNFYGNIGKTLLSLVSIFFDVLFILQHYVIYPAKKTVKLLNLDVVAQEQPREMESA